MELLNRDLSFLCELFLRVCLFINIFVEQGLMLQDNKTGIKHYRL